MIGDGVCDARTIGAGVWVVRSTGAGVARGVGIAFARSDGVTLARMIGDGVAPGIGVGVARSIAFGVAPGIAFGVATGIAFEVGGEVTATPTAGVGFSAAFILKLFRPKYTAPSSLPSGNCSDTTTVLRFLKLLSRCPAGGRRYTRFFPEQGPVSFVSVLGGAAQRGSAWSPATIHGTTRSRVVPALAARVSRSEDRATFCVR